MALLAGCFLATASHAAQDRSFTNINSAGMFEDVYDLFKYSPAYLPSFQKAALWTQLSNLFNTSDDLMDGSGTSYLVFGGQMNLMDLGRAGMLLDWDSDSTPQGVTDNNSQSDSGFVSSTEVDYLDTNSDGIIDVRAERIADIEKIYNYLGNDIYLVYGIGDFMGLDAGASFRAFWRSYNSTYNPWNSSLSLNENYEEHTYDLTTNTETSRDGYTRTGNLDYGYARYDLTVGGRSQTLLSGFDLVANLGFILNPHGNDYEYIYERNMDSDLSTTGELYEKYSETGIEPDSGYYPGTGLGGLIDLRSDYQWNKQVKIIGEASYEIISCGITDAKQEREDIYRNTYMSGLDLYTDEIVDTESDTYEGSVTDSLLDLRVRGIYQGEGWRLGMGIKASSDTSTTECTTTTTYSNINTTSGRPVAVNNSTVTTVSSEKSDYTYRSNVDTLSFPVGLQIDILKNMPIYFGAEHRITITEDSNSNEVTERTQETTTTVSGDGTSTSTITDISNAIDARADSTVTTNHATYYYYGLTWWPMENIQIDMKNVYRLDYWRDFELSFTFHF